MLRWLRNAEEIYIAVTLAAMTLLTVANVIARYIFNSTILWALEATVFLFAWLIIVGSSYGIKHQLHLGIDTLINAVDMRKKRLLAAVAVLASLAYALLLLFGACDYWYGFVTDKAFLETEDVPMLQFLQFFSVWFNEGEEYEKLPRFIPYFALPLGLCLLTVRIAQASVFIFCGKADRLIASHE